MMRELAGGGSVAVAEILWSVPMPLIGQPTLPHALPPQTPPPPSPIPQKIITTIKKMPQIFFLKHHATSLQSNMNIYILLSNHFFVNEKNHLISPQRIIFVSTTTTKKCQNIKSHNFSKTALVLLSTSVKRFSVSRMQNFFLHKHHLWQWHFTLKSVSNSTIMYSQQKPSKANIQLKYCNKN